MPLSNKCLRERIWGELQQMMPAIDNCNNREALRELEKVLTAKQNVFAAMIENPHC